MTALTSTDDLNRIAARASVVVEQVALAQGPGG